MQILPFLKYCLLGRQLAGLSTSTPRWRVPLFCRYLYFAMSQSPESAPTLCTSLSSPPSFFCFHHRLVLLSSYCNSHFLLPEVVRTVPCKITLLLLTSLLLLLRISPSVLAVESRLCRLGLVVIYYCREVVCALHPLSFELISEMDTL